MEIRQLNEEERLALVDGLALASRLIGEPQPFSIEQIQSLYNIVCDEHAENLEAQIAVGLAFGEAIADITGYEWVRVKDEWGEETSLSPAGLRVACHPISMIQKRIAKKEAVDLVKFRDGIIETIQNRAGSEGYDAR